MQYQEKRGVAFLISNVAVTALYCLVLWLNWQDKFTLHASDLKFWASALLGIMPVHIVVRILIMIAFAVSQHVHPNGDSVDLEDELDKLIDLKSSRLSQNVFLAGVLIGLACLAFGLPAQSLLFALVFSIPISGLCGDLYTLILYRRGV